VIQRLFSLFAKSTPVERMCLCDPRGVGGEGAKKIRLYRREDQEHQITFQRENPTKSD